MKITTIVLVIVLFIIPGCGSLSVNSGNVPVVDATQNDSVVDFAKTLEEFRVARKDRNIRQMLKAASELEELEEQYGGTPQLWGDDRATHEDAAELLNEVRNPTYRY